MSTARLSPPPMELPYMVLRAAQALFDKSPSQLEPQELQRARRQAEREYEIEARILNAPEAAGVIVSDEETDRAMAEIKARYTDAESFQFALQENDLDEAVLRQALARQCKVNTILERIDAGAGDISEVDVGIYYHAHRRNFQLPERREAYHILISINEDFPENARPQALERIGRIIARLEQKPKLFEELAQKHSECPTAMRGGRIGLVRRGQLYPQLDEVLFTLRPGQISKVLESEMGFHVILCKNIQPAETVSLQKATPQIRKLLRERFRESRRRAWIASLNPNNTGD